MLVHAPLVLLFLFISSFFLLRFYTIGMERRNCDSSHLSRQPKATNVLDQIRQNILANKRRCYRYAQTWYPRAQLLALFHSHPPRQESDREDRRWNSFFHHHHHHHLILLSVGTLWNAVRKLLLRCRHRHHRQISTPWDKDFQSAPRIIIIAISVITKMKKISMNQCLDREGALSQMPSKETWEIRWLTP